MYDEKLALFLKTFVMTRGKNKQKQSDGTPVPLGRESNLAYIKAVVYLYNQQKELGFNNHGYPRGSVVKRFLDTNVKKETKRKRDEYEDRGKNTLNDGYTNDELAKVNEFFLLKTTSLPFETVLAF